MECCTLSVLLKQKRVQYNKQFMIYPCLSVSYAVSMTCPRGKERYRFKNISQFKWQCNAIKMFCMCIFNTGHEVRLMILKVSITLLRSVFSVIHHCLISSDFLNASFKTFFKLNQLSVIKDIWYTFRTAHSMFRCFSYLCFSFKVKKKNFKNTRLIILYNKKSRMYVVQYVYCSSRCIPFSNSENEEFQGIHL